MLIADGLVLSAKICFAECPLGEAELFDLDEAFITSTLISEIDGRPVGNARRGERTTQ